MPSFPSIAHSLFGHLLRCAVAAVLIFAGGCGSPSAPTTDPPAEPTFDRTAEILNSQKMMKEGDLAGAAEALRRVLLADPNDAETLFRFANVQAAQGKLAEAVTTLDSIPPDHPEAGLAALGRSADWCMQIGLYHETELRYQKVIELSPDAAIAHRQLAYLLNRQGRRHEAAEHIRHLCRLGDVREDELKSLVSLSDAIYDDPRDADKIPAGTRPYFPIGPGGQARKLFAERKYAEAADLLSGVFDDQPVVPSLVAFYGRALAEAQDERQFLAWLGRTDDATKQFAEYWAAVGAYLVDQQRFEEAVRALGESLRRDPTDMRSFNRINQALVALGKTDDAKTWYERYSTQREVTVASDGIGASDPPDVSLFPVVTAGLAEMGRPLESVTWELVEAFYRKLPSDKLAELNTRRSTIASADNAFGTDADRLCGMDIDSYPLPDLKIQADTVSPGTFRESLSVDAIAKPRFENVAQQVGLNHHYRVAADPLSQGFAIYQSVGGGVAVTDYDLDGSADLYLAQGGSDPPEFVGTRSNILYRSTGSRLTDVTQAAAAIDTGYSIGVTAGDWNQDGFPDLVVANLGANTLLINNGDGTFRSEPTDDLDDATVMSTSLAMADVTGDALPDIIELVYSHDSSLFKKPTRSENGEMNVIAPLDFEPALDRIMVNDGSGRRDVTNFTESPEMKATGLGLVITDFDGSPGNEVFVGNDVRPDQFWKRNQDGGWTNMAPIAGCALGSGGSMVASMGIAAGDFDGSGTIDLYITNFENEKAILFLSRGTTFQDRSIQYKLAADSYALLGFGCQGIDYSNDGNLDIVVTNGHVENTGAPEQPFEQPAQLFVNLQDRFQLLPVDDPSGYFDSNHVGRGLARLDFNRDGKPDFVVTHLEAPTALLINDTETDNHWLDLRMIGTQCERDAVGTNVQIRAGQRTWTGWVTAGDGYLCRNEAVVSFGLGAASEVDEIIVTWADGDQQTFASVPADQRIIIVQGQTEWFAP